VLPKVKQQLELAHRDVVTVAADLQRGVQRNMREMRVSYQRMQQECVCMLIKLPLTIQVGVDLRKV
jgi:hypothetical protein